MVGAGPIRTLLVANRGEIACRVFRAARKLGIRTIAVYSDADASALHVRIADRGPAAVSGSYLSIAEVLSAAQETEADAIHPGYGFLSENADFAEACVEAGIRFIGPSSEAIRAMGDKARAKALMAQVGVPVVPGYEGEHQSAARLRAAA